MNGPVNELDDTVLAVFIMKRRIVWIEQIDYLSVNKTNMEILPTGVFATCNNVRITLHYVSYSNLS